MSKADGKTFNVNPQSLSKTSTKIQGLDEVLHGGLPTGRLTIVNGGPGSGKTLMGLELLLGGTRSGQSAVFISFEESSEAIRRNALTMGWDLAKVEEDGDLAMVNPEIDYEAVSSGTFTIEGLCAILEGQVRKIGAELIVIDAIDMLMRLFNDPSRAQNQLVTLHRWLSEHELTAVMTVKASKNNQRDFDYLDFMADCVITLGQRVQDRVPTRRLKVNKYRGSGFSSREHPFIISKQGIVVMPLTSVDLVEKTKGDFVSTANDEMDDILGGGYRRGSSVIVSGASGSGKTTLAFMFSEAAAKRGERVLYLSFEQSELALISEMKSVGYDLKSLIKEGNLRITSFMPESAGMEEHLFRIIQQIEEYQPEHLVLDAISATHRIGSDQAARDFLVRLYFHAKKRGITCIFTNQTFVPMSEDIKISGMGISSLVDTALILSFFREKDQIRRKLLVLKSRGTDHSMNYHEFFITDNGISIGDS